MTDPRFLQNGFDKCMAHVVEECGEVLAAAGKTQRWGPLSVNPLLPVEQQETNIDWLRRELTDLKGAVGRLEWWISEEFPS
jgi:NTP pyrophosphatase (non-canonical NTP hydrolase)